MMLTDLQIQFGNDKRDKLSNACLQCPYLQLCHGECPKNRFISLPAEPYPLNYLCPGLKRYFEHTRPAMLQMAELLQQDKAPAEIMQQVR